VLNKKKTLVFWPAWGGDCAQLNEYGSLKIMTNLNLRNPKVIYPDPENWVPYNRTELYIFLYECQNLILVSLKLLNSSNKKEKGHLQKLWIVSRLEGEQWGNIYCIFRFLILVNMSRFEGKCGDGDTLGMRLEVVGELLASALKGLSASLSWL
jgi:hypothetical protein